MQFTIWVKDDGADDSTAWSEKYNKPVINAQTYAEDIIANFNAALRPCERLRVLLRVEVVPNDVRMRHDWRKISLVTQIVGQRIFDRYECKQCGATGKRHGVIEGVKPDSGTPKWCHPARPAPAASGEEG